MLKHYVSRGESKGGILVLILLPKGKIIIFSGFLILNSTNHYIGNAFCGFCQAAWDCVHLSRPS